MRDLDTDAIVDKSDVIGYGLNVDSGLGIFDAFVASFSMIMVSEVLGYIIFNIMYSYY